MRARSLTIYTSYEYFKNAPRVYINSLGAFAFSQPAPVISTRASTRNTYSSDGDIV